jgi:hypothetical protein
MCPGFVSYGKVNYGTGGYSAGDRSTGFLIKVGKFLPGNTASHLRKKLIVQ